VGDAVDPAAKAIEESEKRAIAALNRADEESERLRPQGRPHEGLRKQLEKEESDTASKREENLRMALISAGLGMLAGTSQYAMVNIGAGGAQGLKMYREGMKDLEKAAERRQELFMKLEEADRAEQAGRADRARDIRLRAVDVQRDSARDAINGIRQVYGVKQNEAKAIFEATERARMEQVRLAQQAKTDDRADNRAEIAASTALLSSLGRKLADNKQRKDLLGALGGITPQQKLEAQGLDEERKAILAEIARTEATLRRLTGGDASEPAPRPGAAPPANRPPLESFQR